METTTTDNGNPEQSQGIALRCPNGHPVVKLKEKLHQHQGHVHDYSCGGCARKLDREEKRWKCEHHCKWNVCQVCFDEQQRTGVLPSVSSKTLGNKALLCPNGHQVVKMGEKMHHWKGSHSCSTCAMKLGRDDMYWKCEHQCKFSVCHGCFEEHESGGVLSTIDTGSPGVASSKAGPTSNGFAMVEEGEPISVRSENVAPFSLPKEALNFQPKPNLVVAEFTNGDKERKIYCNIELNEEELNGLKSMQRQVRARRKSYFPRVSVASTRFLSTARGNINKALGMMDEAQAWRTTYFGSGPITDESVTEDMKHGIIYFTGRDSALRPAIVVRANRVPDAWYKEKSADRLLKILIFSIEYMIRYMCIPGKSESCGLIVDLNGLGVSQVPFKELKQIYSVMSHFYAGRLARIYICNLSTVLSMGMSAAKALLTDRQKQKIVYVKEMSQLLDDFAPHQLEQDLGGTRPIIKSFFPFPIAPGPYEISCLSGPDEHAVANLWEVFNPSTTQGRLWDPRKSDKQNTFLEYSADAVEIFRRLNLPVPEDALNPPTLMASVELVEEGDEELDIQDEVLDAQGMFACCSFGGGGLTATQDNTEVHESTGVVQSSCCKGFF